MPRNADQNAKENKAIEETLEINNKTIQHVYTPDLQRKADAAHATYNQALKKLKGTQITRAQKKGTQQQLFKILEKEVEQINTNINSATLPVMPYANKREVFSDAALVAYVEAKMKAPPGSSSSKP
jgi:hypothetical protein